VRFIGLPDCVSLRNEADAKKKAGSYELAAEYYYKAVECFLKQGREKKARGAFKELKKLYDKQKNDLEKNAKYYELGQILFYLFLSNKAIGGKDYKSFLDKAIRYFSNGETTYRNRRNYSLAANCATKLMLIYDKYNRNEYQYFVHADFAIEAYSDSGDFTTALAFIDELIAKLKEKGMNEKVQEYKDKLKDILSTAIYTYSEKEDMPKEAGLMLMRQANLFFEENNEKKAIKSLENALKMFKEANAPHLAVSPFFTVLLYYLVNKKFKDANAVVSSNKDFLDKEIVSLSTTLIESIKNKDAFEFGSTINRIKELTEGHKLIEELIDRLTGVIPSISVRLSSEYTTLEKDDECFITLELENTYVSDVKVVSIKFEATSNLKIYRKGSEEAIHLKSGAKYLESIKVKALHPGQGKIYAVAKAIIDGETYNIKTNELNIRVPALKPNINVDFTLEETAKNEVTLKITFKNTGEGPASDISYSLSLPSGVVVLRGFVKNTIGRLDVGESKTEALYLHFEEGGRYGSAVLDIKYYDDDRQIYEAENRTSFKKRFSVEDETPQIVEDTKESKHDKNKKKKKR